MKEGLMEARYQALMRDIQKEKNSHVSVNEFRFDIPNGSEFAKNYNFDIRKHYKMLKQNHPLSCTTHPKKQNHIKKTYITVSQNQSVKTVNQASKNTFMKKYGKQKLAKFRKGDEINFQQLHDKIQSIGQ